MIYRLITLQCGPKNTGECHHREFIQPGGFRYSSNWDRIPQSLVQGYLVHLTLVSRLTHPPQFARLGLQHKISGAKFLHCII
jgi:hypothetical protein